MGEGKRLEKGGGTYFTTSGAMTLQGPHQVAKQSRTMREFFSSRAVSKSDLLVARARSGVSFSFLFLCLSDGGVKF